MFLKRILPFLILPLFLGLGCTRQGPDVEPPGPNVVASYDGGMITRDQLKEKFDSLLPCCIGRYEGVDGARALVKEMVLPVVVSKAIKLKKIDLRENIREKMGGLTNDLNISFLHMKFHEQILNDNEKYSDLKEMYEYQRRVLKGTPLSERDTRLTQIHEKIHKSIAKEVEEVTRDYIQKLESEASITKNYDVLRIKVTREELKDFYLRHREGFHSHEYRVPDRVRVREIRVRVDEAGEDGIEEKEQKAREAAEAALTEIRSGAGFRAVAEKHAGDSDEPIKSLWYARGTEDKAFDENVFSLEVGEISRVFKSGKFFHLVKVLEKQKGRFKAYEEILDQIEREYRWQKGEVYFEENRDRILFNINGKPYTIGDFIKEYKRDVPSHDCHHMKKMDEEAHKGESPQLCDLAHNEFDEQKRFMDQMVERELIIEDTYSQMIDVEHQKEIEFLTMASLYPLFHREEMEKIIQVTDEMVEKYYQENKDRYKYPAKAKINMIVIRGGEKEEELKKAFQIAKKAYEELRPSFFSSKKEKDFAEVALKYSDDKETASKGGRLEVDVHECREAVEYMLLHGFHKKIFELKKGEISDIFEFGGNYYILQIREMEKRRQIGFQEVKERVKKELRGKKHEAVMGNWEDDLLKSAGFVVYKEPLKEALAEFSAKDSPEVKGS